MSRIPRFLVALVILCTGCFRSNDEYPIEGVVGGCRGPADESYINVTDQLPGDCVPLADAVIQLSFDPEGKQVVEGYGARSDASGRYTLVLNGVPRGPDPHGNEYYLQVRKGGYRPLAARIAIGPLSSHRKNSVILKPDPAAAR
jgi:hypothetical protein